MKYDIRIVRKLEDMRVICSDIPNCKWKNIQRQSDFDALTDRYGYVIVLLRDDYKESDDKLSKLYITVELNDIEHSKRGNEAYVIYDNEIAPSGYSEDGIVCHDANEDYEVFSDIEEAATVLNIDLIDIINKENEKISKKVTASIKTNMGKAMDYFLKDEGKDAFITALNKTIDTLNGGNDVNSSFAYLMYVNIKKLLPHEFIVNTVYVQTLIGELSNVSTYNKVLHGIDNDVYCIFGDYTLAGVAKATKGEVYVLVRVPNTEHLHYDIRDELLTAYQDPSTGMFSYVRVISDKGGSPTRVNQSYDVSDHTLIKPHGGTLLTLVHPNNVQRYYLSRVDETNPVYAKITALIDGGDYKGAMKLIGANATKDGFEVIDNI